MGTSSLPLLQLSVVIPAYNEASRLGRTLTDTFAYLRLQPFESEVFVVDDGSSDQTQVIAEDFAVQTGGRLKVLRNPGRRGKGFAVRHGVMSARGEVVLFFDADLATPLSEVRKLLEPLMAGRCDVAIGSRRQEQRETQSAMRQFLGRNFKRAQRLMLGLPFNDTQCGFKAAKRDAAHAIFGHQLIEGFAFDVEILLIAQRQGWRVDEVPVEWADQAGSKVRPIVSSLSMLREILGLWVRPKRNWLRHLSGAAVRVIASDGTAEDSFVRNVSEGGLFVNSARILPTESSVTVLLPLPDGYLLPLYGKVVRQAYMPKEHGGVGIQFVGLNSETQSKLRHFLEHLAPPRDP